MSVKSLTTVGRRSLVSVIFLTCGCGTRTYPVQGRVVWSDGSPAAELAQGQVVFESAALKTSARGDIRPDGGFLLSTFQADDGVLPGEYKVLVLEHRPAPEGKPVAPAVMNPKFSDFATSGLTATVTNGPNPVTVTVERAAKKGGTAAPDKK